MCTAFVNNETMLILNENIKELMARLSLKTFGDDTTAVEICPNSLLWNWLVFKLRVAF